MGTYRHVMIATDFSESAGRAAERGAELARKFGARLTLLNVVDYFPEDIPTDAVGPENVDPMEYLARRSRDALAECTRRLRCEDALQEVVCSESSATHEIVRVARERGVDLIVVGTYGRAGVTGLLKSTAHGVLNKARCDVLLVRPTP